MADKPIKSYSINQVCDMLNLSRGYIAKEIKYHRIEVVRFGRAVRITEQQLTDYINSKKMQ